MHFFVLSDKIEISYGVDANKKVVYFMQLFSFYIFGSDT